MLLHTVSAERAGLDLVSYLMAPCVMACSAMADCCAWKWEVCTRVMLVAAEYGEEAMPGQSRVDAYST